MIMSLQVDLACNFAILQRPASPTVPISDITGNIESHRLDAMTGFTLTLDMGS
jgi:hypothetical protein